MADMLDKTIAIGVIRDSVAHPRHQMRASEFIVERKRKRKKPRWAAYGPGPYGAYGYATGYGGGDGGVGEGWKDWAAAGALGTALAFGGAGDAEAAKKKSTNVIQQVSKKDIAKSVTGNPHEVFLKKEAEKAGIKGSELAAFLAQCAHEKIGRASCRERVCELV